MSFGGAVDFVEISLRSRSLLRIGTVVCGAATRDDTQDDRESCRDVDPV
jgi:hypothetical protein